MDDNLKQNLGVVGSVAALSGASAVSGLGAAGITAGLAVIGDVIGGGMPVALPAADRIAGAASCVR